MRSPLSTGVQRSRSDWAVGCTRCGTARPETVSSTPCSRHHGASLTATTRSDAHSPTACVRAPLRFILVGKRQKRYRLSHFTSLSTRTSGHVTGPFCLVSPVNQEPRWSRFTSLPWPTFCVDQSLCTASSL
ncbi:hypothetical protein NP493_200g02014 [Ridgeia piscesae]|uniref:Uncharacterized protein n=1 Tax=Ridgeia piscesae TaxID=27915 RepID=A0AAD9P1S7_RIDPI|nr:hypothetical protein NP493_200g02014 [Ridgeia piscesae]